MELIDGKATAAQIKEEIAAKVRERAAEGKKIPHLAAILVGHDGGSESYVANKIKACEACGFRSSLIRFESTGQNPLNPEELFAAIDKLNNDPEVDGFIVQLPLPKHIDDQKVIEAIDPDKDVDGFHPVNVGRASLGLRYAGWNHGTPQTKRDKDSWEKCGYNRKKQYRRPSFGFNAYAQGCRRHCNRMPFGYQKPGRYHP